MAKIYTFDELKHAPLQIDAVYQGGTDGNAGDDPLSRLMGCGNQGGFRYRGSPAKEDVRLVVLYSNLVDLDWPDELDVERGRFTYYGDNKKPGHSLHDTPRRGNRILRDAFANLHRGRRDLVPPFFIFSKSGGGRDVVFRGLAVPGAEGLAETEDLIAIWRARNSERFQNYRSEFTVLKVAEVSRVWIDQLIEGKTQPGEQDAPTGWMDWVAGGPYAPLLAEPTVKYRKPSEQLPADAESLALLETLVAYFKGHRDGEYAFERCAGALFRRLDRNVVSLDFTRPWRDGGRDAVGEYRIGTAESSVHVEFALEAKCKTPAVGNSSGVKITSRLISRLRHRQLGVFVTTSCVGLQAYKEIVEDRHPVFIMAGRDITELLTKTGLETPVRLQDWLSTEFP